MTKSNDTGEILLKVWKSHQGPAAETYDEVLRDVSCHAHEEHSIGKTDIGALVVWKRLNASTRWAKKLMLTPESRVRESTGKAWWIANDDTRSIADAGGAARGASGGPGSWWGRSDRIRRTGGARPVTNGGVGQARPNHSGDDGMDAHAG